MFRLIKMTFYGEYRGPKETWDHVHESPATMTVPLWILAVGAVVVGYLGIPNFLVPGGNRFEAFLEPSFPVLPPDWTPHPHEVVALARVDASCSPRSRSRASASSSRRSSSTPARRRSRSRRRSSRPSRSAYRWVRNKYFVDEFYEAVFVNGLVKKGGRLLWEIDARVVDGVVNGTRHLTVGFSHVSNWFDKTFVDGAVNGVGDSFQAALQGLRKAPDGADAELRVRNGRGRLRPRLHLHHLRVTCKDAE